MSSAARLLALYEDVEDATSTWLAAHPGARCDAGCADCCRTKPPLVNKEEAARVLEVLATLPAEQQQRIKDRARTLALGMAAGEPADFVCPLLEEDAAGVGRCSVYVGRPYACRTFGHSARLPQDSLQPTPFTCARLMPRVLGTAPPVMPFRSVAMRELVRVDRMVDSWLPIWVGLEEDAREERESGPQQAVVVPKPR